MGGAGGGLATGWWSDLSDAGLEGGHRAQRAAPRTLPSPSCGQTPLLLGFLEPARPSGVSSTQGWELSRSSTPGKYLFRALAPAGEEIEASVERAGGAAAGGSVCPCRLHQGTPRPRDPTPQLGRPGVGVDEPGGCQCCVFLPLRRSPVRSARNSS